MPVARRRHSQPSDPPDRKARNQRISARDREAKLASRLLGENAPAPLFIPVTALYQWIAWIFMVPLCFVTLLTLCLCLNDGLEGGLWRSAPFWFFSMGFIMWLIWFLFQPRPVTLYVWGHEMTHALTTILCGGGIREFHVTASGGHVVTTKNNLLIALSPYFVPLYSLLAVLLFLLAGLFLDLNRAILLPWGGMLRPWHGFYFITGLTWSFHISFTIWMIGKDQPDLRINGVFFSLCLIVFVNLLVLSGMLMLASPTLNPAAFGSAWLQAARSSSEAIREIFLLLRSLIP
jgi:hypothetical protein